MIPISKSLLPNSTAFATSLCVMAVEITAGRLIAGYLGSSLYTWSAIIGVVLAGIALGNAAGGWAADRYAARGVLARALLLASAACALIPVVNHWAGGSVSLWLIPSWPLRVVLHVGAVFFLPSLLLGVTGPVVAKFALERSASAGKALGGVYAWGSAGGIAGAFAAGFVLIPAMGSSAIIWAVALVLGLIAALYAGRRWLFILWIAVLTAVTFVALSPSGWAQSFGARIMVREPVDAQTVFRKESPYSSVRVLQARQMPGLRRMVLDHLINSIVDLNDPANLEGSYQYPYMSLYKAIADTVLGGDGPARAMMIGGGGYVLPRYLAEAFPEVAVEVIEVDPVVTEAAREAMGFDPGDMRVLHDDARNVVNRLAGRAEGGRYAVIFGDAISGLAVPAQLTTVEFNRGIRELLEEDGLYAVNIIDRLSEARFLGALINTFKSGFPHVAVFAANVAQTLDWETQSTFVIVASKRPFDARAIASRALEGRLLTEEEVEAVRRRAGDLTLTDERAPVEYLLRGVTALHGRSMASAKISDRGNEHLQAGRHAQAIAWYKKALDLDPRFARALNNLGNAYAQSGKLEEAAEAYRQAIAASPRFAEPHSNLATLYHGQGRSSLAIKHYLQALEIRPEMVEIRYNFASVLLGGGNAEAAAEQFERIIALRPGFVLAYKGLGVAQAKDGQWEEARRNLSRAVEMGLREPDIYFNLGVVALQLGQDARAWFEECLRLDPGHARARALLDGLPAASSP